MHITKPKKTKPQSKDTKDYYVTLVVDTPVAGSTDSLLRQGFSHEDGKLVYTPPKKTNTP
jgi:hypothetical protein